MRQAPLLLTLPIAAALALAGCAAAVPGYSPPGVTKTSGPLAAPFQAGKVDPAGAYAVSDAERGLTCGKLTGSMRVIMRRLDDTQGRPQQSESSKAVQKALAPVATAPQPLSTDSVRSRDIARLAAFNGLLTEKKCPTLDIAKYQ